MKINANNFDKTLIKTLQTVNNATTLQSFYLDEHLLDGTVYYTVSADEVILRCYNDRDEAEEYLESLMNKNHIIHKG